MIKLPMLSILFFLSINVYPSSSNIIHKDNSYYFSDRITIKFKTYNSLNKISNARFQKFGETQLNKTFSTTNNFESDDKNLKNIYTLKFSSPYDIDYVLKEVSKLPDVEWAEPHYLYQTNFQPNDSLYQINKQRYLSVIKAEEAWEINKGSSDIIIGIVDTGIDWEHPDLAANIWTNPNEIASNGIDDDNNGYVDDIRGWDFGGLDGTPDNNPDEDRSDHGTLVAGLASAVTNNGIGIASLGYQSKLMSVKTSGDNIRDENNRALISYGYEGIVYAVNNGAKIINCSWGGNSFSQADQAVINYAVSKGVLIVAAAGNDNSSDKFYPADYQGVLSVAATDTSDIRAYFSNFGTQIDVCSPGVEIYSTWKSNPFYISADGTSLASPIVAGLAALVSNQFPTYNGIQVGEQIRVNTDNIDDKNPNFAQLLGTGRINAYQSLINTNSKSVRISNTNFTEVGDGDGLYESGEIVNISPTFTNYLNSLSNLSITLETNNSNVQIIKNGGTIGSLATLQTTETSPDFFSIKINSNAGVNLDINFQIVYQADNYQDFEWITISINPTYNIQTTDNLSITFTSNGSIGFDDFPTNLKGNGLRFKDGPNLMFEGALMYGTSANTIVNCARDNTGNKDEDFTIVTPIKSITNNSNYDEENYAVFNDTNASPKGLGIETEFYSYSFAGDENADYMIVRYAMSNKSTDTLNNFYIGQYFDFDIDDTSYSDDIVNYDSLNNFGYAYDDNGDPVTTNIGLALLSNGTQGFFAMDAEGISNPTISYDGFTDAEKWTSLTSGLKYKSSGPNDISLVISGGPFTLVPNVNQNFDFLIACGDDLASLTQTVIRAKKKYNGEFQWLNQEISNQFELYQNFPNPYNIATTIRYSVPNLDNENLYSLQLIVYDFLGRKVATLVNGKQNPGNYSVMFDASNLSSGVYFYRLSYGNFVSVKKMILLK